jgi:2-hydroxy-6-oxonona-2,4-dienedioate hydrolase
MTLTEEGLIKVPGLNSRWVRLGSGARAHYMTAGESGPSVVLLHGGLPGSSGTAGWRFMAPFLASRGFRVYCPDQPGFGLADTREEYWPTGPESHVDFLHEFANALCLDRFHLAGNSMGTAATANYVVAHPERIISFAMIAGSVGDVVEGQVPLREGMGVPRYDGSRESMKAMMESIVHRPEVITDDLLTMRHDAAERQAQASKAFFERFTMYLGRAPWDDANVAARLSTKGRLDRLSIPGIYLYGRQDTMSSVESGYAQEDALPNVQFFYPDECGHQGQTDQPEMFNQVFAEFFATGKVSRRTADWAGVSARRPEIASIVEQD